MASTDFGFMGFLVLMIVLLPIPTGSVMGKPEGKRPAGRPSCRWEGNISIDFK